MGRIGADGQPDVLVGGAVQPLDVSSQMVFDVPGSLVGGLQSGELGEDLIQGFAADVGEDVEATSAQTKEKKGYSI